MFKFGLRDNQKCEAQPQPRSVGLDKAGEEVQQIFAVVAELADAPA